MPTVGDFTRAAALLEDAGAQARTLISPVRAAMGPEVLTGGALSRSTDSTIAARTGDAHAVAAELFRLATECRLRAAAVATAAAEAAAYADAMVQYDARRELHVRSPQAWSAPRPPSAPPAPPSWADF